MVVKIIAEYYKFDNY